MFVVIIRDKATHLRVLQAPKTGGVLPLSSSSEFRLEPNAYVVVLRLD
jgi:hypothetical protein